MARWVALGLAGQRVGEPFEAPDRAAALAAATQAHGARVVMVQSVLSWQESQALLRRGKPADE